MRSSQLYKVLIKGRSCHGGDKKWSLPRGGKPGDWLELPEGEFPVCCECGFHLTTEPNKWFVLGASVFEAEGGGQKDSDGSDKTAFQRARLLRRVPKPIWLRSAEAFLKSIPSVNWFSGFDKLPAGCRLFETRYAATEAAVEEWDDAWAAACEAAYKAAREAARGGASDAVWHAAVAATSAIRVTAVDAMGDASNDAALLATCLLVQDLIDPKHLAYAITRWAVWQAGYGVACDVRGEIYAYRRP